MQVESKDIEAWDETRDRASKLKAFYSARDAQAEEQRRMFHLEWKEKPEGDWIKETMSPSAYNSITGAVRLLTATDPQFNVSSEKGNKLARGAADRLEAAAKIMWDSSGRITGRKLHYEMALSSLLNAEIVAYSSATADLVEYAQQTQRKGNIVRAQRAQRLTPYLLAAHNPAACYTERDMLGVSAVLRSERVTWGSVCNIYGDDAKAAGGLGASASDMVMINEWWDYDRRVVWVDGHNDPIVWQPNEDDYLPVVSAITDGSLLWPEPERQRTPFLYALAKSKIWQRQNLMLTVIYSLVFGIGSNPLLVHETDDDSDLQVDHSVPGFAFKIKKGDRLSALNEKVLDPSLMQGWQLALGIDEESTIPRVALGAPPAGSMPFSAISLLAQSGRLPLIGTRQGIGDVAAELIGNSLQGMKRTGSGKLYDRSGLEIDLSQDEIPQDVPIDCVVDVSLPQDKLQMANAALALKQGELVTTEWIQQNILGVGQTGKMSQDMMREQLGKFMLQEFFKQTSAKDEAAIQRALQGADQMANATTQAGADVMASRMEQQIRQSRPMPAEISGNQGAYPPGGVQPGAPLAAPLQPQGMGGD